MQIVLVKFGWYSCGPMNFVNTEAGVWLCASPEQICFS